MYETFHNLPLLTCYRQAINLNHLHCCLTTSNRFYLVTNIALILKVYTRPCVWVVKFLMV